MALSHRWRMVGAYASMIGASVAYLFLPKFFGDAVDEVKLMLDEGSIDSSVLIYLMGIILFISLIRGLLSFFQTYLGEAVSQFVSYDIRNNFYNHIQHLSFGFHDRFHTGNLMSRAITDVENIRMFVNMGIVRTPYFLSLFVVVAIILVKMDWQLGLVSISFMRLVAVNSGFARIKLRRAWLHIQDMMADLNTVLQENLTLMYVS